MISFLYVKSTGKKAIKDFFSLITWSPNHYPSYKTSKEIKSLQEYKESVVIVDDMLGPQNSSSQIHELITKGSLENLDAS